MAEFDVQQWLGENPEEEEEPGNPCPVCNSAEREDVLLLCDSCDAAYHTHCIGLEDIPGGDWYCMECSHLFQLTDEPRNTERTASQTPRIRQARRPVAPSSRGFHVRTRERQRRATRQARNQEWQGAWGQFTGRFYEMSDLDLDNFDDEDEDLGHFRRLQQLDRRELQRWQQRMNIAQRLGARESFVNNIPPQISEQLQPVPSPPQETEEERHAWIAFERAREIEENGGQSSSAGRKRKTRSVTASPAEPVQEPERKLKRPRTRRLPTQSEGSTSVSSPAAAAAIASSSAAAHGTNGVGHTNGQTSPVRNGASSRLANDDPPLVSSLLKELEPSGGSDDESLAITAGWRPPMGASSPVLSPITSAHSSPRALSLTPPPFPGSGGRPISPTLPLSTNIEPVYPPSNYSPNRAHSDSEARSSRHEGRSLELRQPRPRRPRPRPPPVSRADEASPSRPQMTQDDKKNINEFVKTALRPHWRAQKLTTEQYATINRDISRKLYDEVKSAAALDEESRRAWERRATQEVAQAVSELQA